MSEWKPIETAPRDGTFVLLALGETIGRDIWIGAWLKHYDGTYPYTWQDQELRTISRPWKDDPEPTHWQPLPEPPK